MSFVTISNTLGAEFSNIIDNYKPAAWSTQYWITGYADINTVKRVDNFGDTNDYFDMCLADGMGYGTTDCPIVVGHITRFQSGASNSDKIYPNYIKDQDITKHYNGKNRLHIKRTNCPY
jgi:hypothetical protein